MIVLKYKFYFFSSAFEKFKLEPYPNFSDVILCCGATENFGYSSFIFKFLCEYCVYDFMNFSSSLETFVIAVSVLICYCLISIFEL